MADELVLFGDEDEIVESVLTSFLLAVVMLMVSQQMQLNVSRVQIATESPGAYAQNVGFMWYEVTPLGQPNRLKMIGENSTGAFEEILVALST